MPAGRVPATGEIVSSAGPSGGNVKDALILRRYKAPAKQDLSDAWTVPDDRKVNPWDLNEVNPTDTGTMGTIPGPVIECSVGDSVVVHYRNLDRRDATAARIEQRVHSLHPHGFVFKNTSDGNGTSFRKVVILYGLRRNGL